MYQVQRHSTSHFVALRRHHYHVREWGNPQSKLPPLILAHGWMDVAASWQFMVDALTPNFLQQRRILAADWRGYGLTEGPATDSYWLPDYLGDLDALLKQLCPSQSIDLVGHSMGGNVAGIYAGVRPERVSHFVNLEGFGLPLTRPEQAPARYAKWLNELREPPLMRTYPNREAVAARLMKTNPRISSSRADFLAGHWAAPNAEGEWEILGDPAHKITSAILYRTEEVMACWSAITAPVLWVEAADTDVWRWMGPKEVARLEIDRRLQHIRQLHCEVIEDAGHMLHHDQPEALAPLIEGFLP